MKNPLKSPNIKWLFGGIGAAVVGGWIVWKITGGTKPEPAQQITTPLYMPGSGSFGGGGGGGVGPMEDFGSGDAVAIASLMQATEMERIASQERMFMAGLQQSLEQSSPMYAPLTEHSPTTSNAVSLATIEQKTLKSGGTTANVSNAPVSKALVDYNVAQASRSGGTSVEQRLKNMASTGDWSALYTLAKSLGQTSQQVAAATGLNYNEVVAWQQQQNLKVL